VTPALDEAGLSHGLATLSTGLGGSALTAGPTTRRAWQDWCKGSNHSNHGDSHSDSDDAGVATTAAAAGTTTSSGAATPAAAAAAAAAVPAQVETEFDGSSLKRSRP